MAISLRLSHEPGTRRLLNAAAIALVVELSAIGGVVWLLDNHAPPARPEPALMLSMAPPEQTVPDKPPAPPTPAPQQKPPPVTPPRPTPVKHVEPRRPAPTPAPTPLTPTPPPVPVANTQTPTEAAPVVPPAAPPAPPPPAAPSAPAASFDDALRAAIQSALRYPDSARMAGLSGRTRIAFKYRDRQVSDETVVTSSGSDGLDRAALAAVRDAVLPSPGPAFAGKTLSELVWVTFTLNDNDE